MNAQSRHEHRIDARRLAEAMKRAGIPNQRQLAQRVKVWPSNVRRWIDGDTTPAGDTLNRLCKELGVPPSYLFGETEGERAAELDRMLAEVERLLGRGARDAIKQLSELTAHHRTIAVGRLEGWVQALRDVEKATGAMPLTPFDLDEAEAGQGARLEGDDLRDS